MFKTKTNELSECLKQALESELFGFDKIKNQNKSGVYFIYHKDKIIYVGKTERAGSKRLGDMVHHYRSHTLYRKLLFERIKNYHRLNIDNLSDKTVNQIIEPNEKYKRIFKEEKDKIKEHIKEDLKFKFIPLKGKQINYFEHFCIGVISPKYND